MTGECSLPLSLAGTIIEAVAVTALKASIAEIAINNAIIVFIGIASALQFLSLSLIHSK
jgi:hypothetical protein